MVYFMTLILSALEIYTNHMEYWYYSDLYFWNI